MAKNQLDMKSIKNAKKDIQKTVKAANTTLLDFSEDIIKETVKTGEAWQKLMAKAVKNSEPIMKKQSDILFETVKGMKTEAEYSVNRFEKLTGFDFSDIRKTFDVKVPTAPKWVKEGFEYITDQTEDILAEVSKKGDELVESVTDTAKAFAKEAEQMKDKAEAKVKEVIKDVEARISDVAPRASAAAKEVKKPLKKATTTAKKATKKTVATAKKAVKETTSVAKKSAKKTVATAKNAVKETTNTAKKAVKKTAVTATKQAVKTVDASKKIATTAKGALKGDDLKLIEGVGPKLSQILNDAGFMSFALLANAEVKDLQKVLDDAGSRYKMHNPTSWPLQARFARDGKFEALKSWQEKNNAQKA